MIVIGLGGLRILDLLVSLEGLGWSLVDERKGLPW